MVIFTHIHSYSLVLACTSTGAPGLQTTACFLFFRNRYQAIPADTEGGVGLPPPAFCQGCSPPLTCNWLQLLAIGRPPEGLLDRIYPPSLKLRRGKQDLLMQSSGGYRSPTSAVSLFSFPHLPFIFSKNGRLSATQI